MIVSTGIDIVEVGRIRDSMTRTPRFGTRVFTSAERAYCDAKGISAFQSYAVRYAAKEAFLKALGTGWTGKISWQDVEITNDADGVPSLIITGEAARLLEERGSPHTHLSLSHTAEHAIAQVIFETP